MPEKTYGRDVAVSPGNASSGNKGRISPRYLIAAPTLLAMYLVPWKSLIDLCLSDDEYSHIPLVPIIAASVICLERDRIFRNTGYSPWSGALLALVGILLTNLTKIEPALSGSSYDLSISIFGAMVTLVGGFLLCFGPRASWSAAFPLSFLLLLIPVPRPLMAPVVLALQNGSAEVSAVLFKLSHVPAFRQGLKFSLPGFDIEIAQQCSGIRSSIALCIASTLAGHFLLRVWWRRMLLVLITIPLVILKNAVRIATISSLGLYVDRSFLYGTLHRYSGLPFSLVELAILAPIVVRWHRLDSAWSDKARISPGTGGAAK